MKFESQYLTEKYKNKEAIEELENIIKELKKTEEFKKENKAFIIFNTHDDNTISLDIKYKNKKIKIEKEGEKFSGEIMDDKNKIGISSSDAKFLFKKFENININAVSTDHHIDRTFSEKKN